MRPSPNLLPLAPQDLLRLAPPCSASNLARTRRLEIINDSCGAAATSLMNTRRISAQNWGSSLAASLCLLTYTSLGAELTSSTKARLWSLQPLQQPAIPHFSASNPADANPIDAFVRAQLDEKGFHPAPPADRRTLIRR